MPRILAETESIIAIDKPAGLITHSDGRTIEPSLAEWLIARYPGQAGVGEPWVSPQGERIETAGLVQRLDRGTTGVVLAARSNDIYRHLKSEQKARRVRKRYRAVVSGVMEKDSGTVSAEIVRTSAKPRRWIAENRPIDHMRTAITHWSVLARRSFDGHEVSYVELEPVTGRTHQIRVHMAHIGHPLVGDVRYGSQISLGLNRPALHAYGVSVILPDGSVCSYASPVPDDMQCIIGSDIAAE